MMTTISNVEIAQTAHSASAGLKNTTGLTGRLTQFAKADDGNLTIFSVFMFVGILAICGVGVDLMLNEKERTRLQNTLDAAVLAAADLDQKAGAQSVVETYFEAAGLDGALSDVTVNQGLNYKTVSATAAKNTDPLFIGMMGVDNLVAPASGTAEERVSNVEISLIVDISGSMGWSSAQAGKSKLDVLQESAEEFLNIVLDPNVASLTTVNVIPYNHTVNMGSTLASYFTLDTNHAYSNCVRFADSAFDTTAISPNTTLDRLSHFDIWNYNWSTSAIANSPCPPSDYAEIKVHQDSAQDLIDHIDSFSAGGNTAIDLGMKWGVGLLDDTAESVVTNMIADDEIPDMAVSRPAAFDDEETLKIVVLMTDGENTSQWDLGNDVQTGYSNVYIDDRGTSSTSDDRFSVKVDDYYGGDNNDRFFYERYRDWSWSYRYQWGPDGGSNARRMTHAELYARFDVFTVDLRFHERPYYDGYLSWNEYYPYWQRYQTIVNSTQADNRLSDICDEARDESLVIYAIAFEAPTRGVNAMSDCASSDSHFFDVEGAELTETFQSIASSINQLRLIQ